MGNFPQPGVKPLEFEAWLRRPSHRCLFTRINDHIYNFHRLFSTWWPNVVQAKKLTKTVRFWGVFLFFSSLSRSRRRFKYQTYGKRIRSELAPMCARACFCLPPPLPTLRQIFLGEDHTSRFFPRQAPAFPAYLFVINSTMMDVSSWAADAAGWLHASQRDYGWRKKKKKCEHEKNQVTGGAQSDQNNNRGVCTCVHSCQKWPLPLPLFQGLPSLFGTLWSGAQ